MWQEYWWYTTLVRAMVISEPCLAKGLYKNKAKCGKITRHASKFPPPMQFHPKWFWFCSCFRSALCSSTGFYENAQRKNCQCVSKNGAEGWSLNLALSHNWEKRQVCNEISWNWRFKKRAGSESKNFFRIKPSKQTNKETNKVKINKEKKKKERCFCAIADQAQGIVNRHSYTVEK